MNASLLTLALTIGQPGPGPYMPEGPPAMPASPFVFVTVTAPTGTKTTWQPLAADAKTTSAAVGLRPGYIHRFQLSDVPGLKGTSLFPSIEVRGTLIPRKGLPDVSKHPVPITFTDNDIDRIVEGKLITKVYYLEDPEQAFPIQGKAGEPLEGPAATEIEAIREARLRGRPMLIVRVGERPATKEDLAIENTPGTILFADAREFPRPAAPPRFAFSGILLFDPLLGPALATEECLKDGGDVGPRMGPTPTGIGGLDPTDTGMMFTTRRGSKVVASNRVGICVPRFAAARVETAVAGHHTITGPDAHHLNVMANDVFVKVGSAELRGGQQLAGFIGSQRASGLESRTGPDVVNQWSGRPAGLSSINGAQVVAQARGPEEITSFPGSHSLLLRKSIDPPHPENIGDMVMVTLRFSNPTTEEMTDIVIADSLTGRLEYIEGTAKSSRPTTFTMTKNKAGSLVLRWAVDGTLKPGESGKITFQVRIR